MTDIIAAVDEDSQQRPRRQRSGTGNDSASGAGYVRAALRQIAKLTEARA